MKEQSRILNLLGKCDFQLNKLKTAVSSKPDELLAAEKQQESEKTHSSSANEKIEILNKRVQEYSRFIRIEKEKLVNSEKQLLEPKGQKVFLKVRNNIGIINKFVKQSEENIQKLDRELDVLKDELGNSESSMKEIETEVAKIAAVFNESSATHTVEIKKLEAEHAVLTKQVNARWMWKYNKLLERGIIPPVSEVATNHCGECSITFPPQVFQKLLVDHIGECSNCLRILVESPPKEEETTEDTLADNDSQ